MDLLSGLAEHDLGEAEEEVSSENWNVLFPFIPGQLVPLHEEARPDRGLMAVDLDGEQFRAAQRQASEPSPSARRDFGGDKPRETPGRSN